MELDKVLYKESSLRNFYNYTIKFPTEEKYITKKVLCSRVSKWNKYFVIEFPRELVLYTVWFLLEQIYSHTASPPATIMFHNISKPMNLSIN
jgi:hypothetical protein